MNKLPPLPPSDPESLSKNRFDSFYKKGARDFWGDNSLETVELKNNIEQCKHYFDQQGNNVTCKKCHIGWIGKELRVENGVLYVGREQVNI